MLITEREKEKDRLIKLREQRLEEERLKKEAHRLERELQKFRELQRERGNLFDHKKRQEETLKEREVAELEVKRIAERQQALLKEEAQIRGQLEQLDKLIGEGGAACRQTLSPQYGAGAAYGRRIIGAGDPPRGLNETESEEVEDGDD